MHISEGILPVAWAATTGAMALPPVIQGVREINKRARYEPAIKPMLGLMGAAVFVVSALPIPVPIVGTSAHPVGTPLAAIIIKPFPTVIVAGIALFFQALFMAHGGLTTLGANTLAMGVVGAFIGYGVFHGLRLIRAPLWAAAGAAGFLGDLAVYATTALIMALALHGDRSFWITWGSISLAFVPTQVPLAILEAVLTGAMVTFIRSRRPDVFAKLRVAPLSIEEKANAQ